MIRSLLDRLVPLSAGLLLLAALGTAARAETRVALVIGNSAYQHTARLANPQHDARDVATALTATGFQVFEAFDVEKRRLDGVLRAWADAIAKADVALFYYAGHGIQVGQQSYLVPVDARLGKERDLEFEGVRIDFILRQMEIDREGRTSIVILDACRDNPLSRNLAGSMGTRSAAVGRGLGAAPAGLGMFIAYATQPGNVALDGREGERNSPFAKALVKEMLVKGRNINATMSAVRRDVVEATNGQQVPWDHSSLTADFFFVPAAGPGVPPAPTPAPASKESEELAALKERLRKLEEEARQRPAATSPSDVVRLAELKARAASLADLVQDLQRKLLSARMLEGKATDPGERTRLQRDSLNIQMEMTRRSLDLKKLREEISALEGRPKSPSGPAFLVRQSSRVVGTLLAAPPSTANCEARCQTEQPQCVAWNLSRDGICELLATVERREETANWRSGVRSDIVSVPAAAAPAPLPRAEPIPRSEPIPKSEPLPPVAAIPPVKPKPGPPPKVSPDFQENDGVRLYGTEIGESFRAPSPIACREACAKTAACVGYQHGRKIPVMGQCQLFSHIGERGEDDKWRSGVRTTAAGAPAAGTARLVFPAPVSRSKLGFHIYDGVTVRGTSIKTSQVDSVDGCLTVCRNTAGCLAARAETAPARTGIQCVALGSIDGAEPASGTTTIVRAER